MNNCKFIFIFLCLILMIGCYKDRKTASSNDLYISNYTSLIEEYLKDGENVEQFYKKRVQLPKKNFNITFFFKLYKKFNMNDKKSLPSYVFLDSPRVLDYALMGYVFINGDVWFSKVRNSMNSLYVFESDDVIRDKSISALYSFDNKNKILFGDQWYDLQYNKRSEKYFFNENVIVSIAEFPSYFQIGFLLSPIYSNNLFRTSSLSLKFKHNKNTSDLMFLLYDYENDKLKKELILPSTGKYRFFDYGIGNVDSNERIYLKMPVNFRSYFPGVTYGHIMIYDILNDTMYNIRHPLMQNAGEVEELLETNYILGEDENIYYQLVTDKAYYIYKIEPLWDEPMEETDYNPVFFEFYPELKTEWDKL